MDPPQIAAVEELARGLDERRKRAVRIAAEELRGPDRVAAIRRSQPGKERIQHVGAGDVHSPARAEVSAGPRGNQDRDDLSLVTLAVVAAQVARVGCCLVEVGLRGELLALELEDDD